MIADRYTAITRRAVVQVSDGAGAFTETTTDTTIYGYIAEISGSEVRKNEALGVTADCQLFTDSDLDTSDRIVADGVEYEIVWKFTQFGKRYPLKRIR